MKTRSQAIALVLALGAVALSLTGCGGDDKPAAGSSTGGSPASPDTPEVTAGVTDEPTLSAKGGKAIPPIRPEQVQGIVGRWVSGGPVGDYFVFKSDGSGTWITKGRALWTGKAIPAGKNTYRLSWKGQDTDASYWAVKLQSDGKLLFEGNQQTYTKATSAGTATTKAATTRATS